MSEGLQARYERVMEEIESAARAAGRDPDEITLVVVTKGHSFSEIDAAYQLGIREIGENRVGDALEKQSVLEALDGLRWHMIGHIQSRKARDVAGNFALVHSLDSVKQGKPAWCRMCCCSSTSAGRRASPAGMRGTR